MFDDLREMSDGTSMFEEPMESPYEIEAEITNRSFFLGMSPAQRFVISLLLLGTVFVVGLMCLMVTEKLLIF